MSVKFAGLKATEPQAFASSWVELQASLSVHRGATVKTDGALWSPVSYYEGARRGSRGVQYVEALVVDLDGESLDAAKLDGLEWFAYTTWSHRVDAPHYHLVLPLAERVPASLWRAVWLELHERLGVRGDPATKDCGRIFFMPQHQVGEVFEFRGGSGALLDVEFSWDVVDVPRVHGSKSLHRVFSAGVGLEMLSEDWWNTPVPPPAWVALEGRERYVAMLAQWDELVGV